MNDIAIKRIINSNKIIVIIGIILTVIIILYSQFMIIFNKGKIYNVQSNKNHAYQYKMFNRQLTRMND